MKNVQVRSTKNSKLGKPLAGELELETWLSWRLSLRLLDLWRPDDPSELGVDGGVSSDTDVVSERSSTPLTGSLIPAEIASIVLISAAIRCTSRGFASTDWMLMLSSRSASSLVVCTFSDFSTTPPSLDNSASSLTPYLLRQLIIHNELLDSVKCKFYHILITIQQQFVTNCHFIMFLCVFNIAA